MVLIDYPEEIKKMLAICKPYENKVKDGILKDAPQNVIDAFNKTKEWAWSLEQ